MKAPFSLFFTACITAALVSSASAQLASVYGETDWDGFGTNVLMLDDLNGDGTREVAVTGFCTDYVASNSGSIYIYDGATRALLRRHDGGCFGCRLG